VKPPSEVKTPEVGLPPRPTPRGPEPKVTEPAVPPRVAKAPEPKVESPPVPARSSAAQPPAATRSAEPASAPGQTSVAALKSQGWIPAAAFADRAAATRLASSIQQQDYPVEIREDRSSARPWVVWIGPEPRGSSRRRR
jgi:cell division septation protein DedD